MRKISVFVMIMVAVVMIVTSCGQGVNTNAKLSSDVDSALYAIGVANGASFREGLKTFPGAEGMDTYDVLLAGFVAALNDKASQLKMTPEEAQNYLQTYFMEAETKRTEASKAEGEAFLASNKTKQGVITTESGLQYKVITEGTGKRPTSEDNVIVHYT
jgi:FKBP-type peptidyl-prolyl cis-trans isomerase FkpA/FKBP-type peptidyl-prolyl cis-trans isomerase FklB